VRPQRRFVQCKLGKRFQPQIWNQRFRVTERAEYRPSFSADAAEFILSLKKRDQRAMMARAYKLAELPFVKSDYVLIDLDGGPIEHILDDGFVLSYWIDHSEKIVMITEIEDVS
jgi:hypothetical protein